MMTTLKKDLANTHDDLDEDSIDSYDKMKNNVDEMITKRLKPMLKCIVCGDNAFGYNFDAVSCESCKAFFRRTAFKPPEQLKCRGKGHCEVTVEKRKRCKKCRLEKCFEMGMRKEWILTDDEKKRKRNQIEENRRRKQSSKDTSKSYPSCTKKFKLSTNTSSLAPSNSSLLTSTDWSRINQVEFAYSQSIIINKVVGIPIYPATQPIHTTIELIRIPTYLASIRLITFLKQIPEFNTFDLDDRVVLVKYNLLAVVFLHIVLIYDCQTDTYHEKHTEDPIFQGKYWIEIIGENFYHSLINFVVQMRQIIGSDEIIIKTFLLLILFTKGFCNYDICHEPTLKKSLLVYQTQCSYLESLYKYCLYRYDWKKTTAMFTNFVRHLSSIQRLAVHLKNYVHNHIDPSQVSPLMQSVLQLTDSNA